MKSLPHLVKEGMVATGAAIVVFSIGLTVLILVTAVPTHNPYVGLFTIIFLPALVIAGALVFVFGVMLNRPGKRSTEERPTLRKWLLSYFAPDFSRPDQRRRLVFFLVAGAMEIVVFSTAGFRTAQFMDTPQFCASCHKVMDPEYTVYQSSSHARVPCVDCHIGSGTSWLVRSKVTGLRQVWHTITNTYPRPITTPVENLRPARETCEQCHWPQKFSGNISRTFRHYNTDEKNSQQTTSLILKVGSGETSRAEGIHWHISAKVWYLSIDAKRQNIGWVGVEGRDGKLKEYVDTNLAGKVTPENISQSKRLMDCIDCHNRATHVFRSPGELMDMAFARGKMDSSIPFLKDQGLKALSPVNPSREMAISKVESIEEFYRTKYPEIYAEKKASLDESLKHLNEIVSLTTFPEMRVTWETHPDNLGHSKSTGCTRCHGKLVAKESGKPLDASCTLCHDFASR